MKVLLVNKFHYRKGGSETYYFTLAEALKRAGHDVVFFAMEDENGSVVGTGCAVDVELLGGEQVFAT